MLQKRKFTLLELLIVVAILGVLFSILLPSLRNSKRASQKAVCLAQLSQFQRASMLYTSENSGYFPGYITPHDGQQGRNWIGKKGSRGNWPIDITERPVNKYLGLTVDGTEAEQCKCPFNDDDLDVYHKVGSSYSANEYRHWQGIGGLNLAIINQPSKVIFASEFGGMGFLSGENQQYWRMTHFPGTPRYPFAKIDGSVKNHTVINGQGLSFRSTEFILNLRYDD
jgi:prepilin-type N-terminal cleavage/methylation domain-containing protein